MPKVTLELRGSAPRTLVLLCDGADDPRESISSQEPTPHILGRAEEVGDPEQTGHSLRVPIHLPPSRCECRTPAGTVCPSPDLIVRLGSVIFERFPQLIHTAGVLPRKINSLTL